MRFLVVGDVQLLCDDPTSPRSQQSRDTLSWVVSVIEQTQPHVLVHLGDYGESNEGVDHYTLSLMTWFIQAVAHRVPRSYWLVGNHDFFNEDGSINLMSALQPLMPTNHQVVWPWESRGPENTMFVSYLGEGTKERWRTEHGLTFAERESCVLFSHLPIQGAMWSPGIYDDKGMPPNNFPAYTIVGHYHKPNMPSQVQQCFGHAIYYVGSPMSHDFRDNCYGLTKEQQLRGIHLFEIEQGKVTTFPKFFPNPFARYFVSFSAHTVNGQVQDQWFQTECIVPPDRTTLRISVPAGEERAVGASLSHFSRVQTLLHAQTATSGGIVIDPSTQPAHAVVEFINGLPVDRLKGLDPTALRDMGVALVQGGYQVPQYGTP